MLNQKIVICLFLLNFIAIPIARAEFQELPPTQEFSNYLEVNKYFGNQSFIFTPSLIDSYSFFRINVTIDNPNFEKIPLISLKINGVLTSLSSITINDKSSGFVSFSTNISETHLTEAKIFSGNFAINKFFGTYSEFNASVDNSNNIYQSGILIRIRSIFAHNEQDLTNRDNSGDKGYPSQGFPLESIFVIIPVVFVKLIRKRNKM